MVQVENVVFVFNQYDKLDGFYFHGHFIYIDREFLLCLEIMRALHSGRSNG
jgi:hypothetical protein